MEQNSKLRALRESRPSTRFPGEPMSRTELAEAVNAELWRTTGRRSALDAHTIARYERGAVRWPNAAYRSALRVVLGATDEQLGFQPTPRGATAVPVTRAADPENSERVGETADVDRRGFMGAGLAAIAMGAAHRRVPLDYDAVLRDLQATDLARGPQGSIIGATRLLQELAAELHTARGRDRASLLRTGARAAEFAGFLYRDVGNLERSLFWHDRAMDWAQENEDEPMQAYVLLRKAQAAYDQRDAARMLGLTRAARRLEHALSAGLRAEILQQEARGEAMLGLPDHGVQRKLDQARDLLARGPSPDDGDELGKNYSQAMLDLQVAVCLTESGRPRKAVTAYRALLDANSSSPRDRAYFSTLMASALALSGEPDEAARTVRAALPAAVKTGSRRTLREAHVVASALRPWSNRSTVRDLDQALAAAITR